MRPAIVALNSRTLPLCNRVKAALNGHAEIHGPASIAGPDCHYSSLAEHLQVLFSNGVPIIGICASGILIRILAPLLHDKQREPPVIAISEDGVSIIPLLGGHNGANGLASRIADSIGGHAAITTASDVNLGFNLAEPPDGFVLQNRHHAKVFMSAILDGAPIRVVGDASWLAGLKQSDDSDREIRVTPHDDIGTQDLLVYHPKCLAIGLGCERGTSAAEIRSLISLTLANHKLSDAAIACYATIDIKMDEPALAEPGFSPVRFFTASELASHAHKVPNPSNVVLAETGTSSVAEAAALAAAGPDGRLIVPKTKSGRATCAIASSPRPILKFAGQDRGLLSVVGVGPGSEMLRSGEACRQLMQCSDWVGYDLYLDLISDLREEQREHRFPLGGEEERVRHAISLASEGRRVALVCSGDAGIYAMASLVYELLDLEPCRIAVEVIPGISAFQAAAARAGAMIGHDFCCISLSDLLTPWEVIRNRVKSAAEGDFVVSFYNPRSQKRTSQLDEAMSILKTVRPGGTPVVIASNLGRPQEEVRIIPLSSFSSEDVDMLTLVMVGSSQSRMFQRGDGLISAYTPRGYARKRGLA